MLSLPPRAEGSDVAAAAAATAADAGGWRRPGEVCRGHCTIHGRLWRRPAWVGRPPPTIPLHDYSYFEHNVSQTCPVSVVVAECWRADDGSVALVAANHDDSEHALNVSVDLAPSGGAAPLPVESR